MTFRPFARHLTIALAATALALPTGATGAAPARESYELGRDTPGDPCTATARWQAGGAGGVRVLSEQPYVIACRGASAARVQGVVAPVIGTPGEVEGRDCATTSKPVAMRGTSGASARLCYDATLGFEVVEIRFSQGGRNYVGAAARSALGPLEAALRAVAGIDYPKADAGASPAPVSVDLAGIEPAPAPKTASAALGTADVSGTLTQGVALIHRGLHADASRVLNDAQSRITADTPQAVRIEIALAAGLADSNIGQTAGAQAQFAAAAAALAANPDVPRAAFLQRKRVTYQALDLVNRRLWQDALTVLDSVPSSDKPLLDPLELSRLNQTDIKADVKNVSVSDADSLGWLTVEASRNLVRSTALLALGRVDESAAALDRAAANVTQLQRSVAPASIVWLRSGIQRQQGRIAMRRKDYAAAVKSFDCAISTLQGFAQAAGSGCLMSDPVRGITAYPAASGPVVAETQLERASALALVPGTDRARVLAEYRAAADTLAVSPTTGEVPAGMTTYLDLLLASAAAGEGANLDEDYFRALQATSDPAIARDVARLRDDATGDAAIGAKVRDRADFAERITALRFRINALPAGDPQIAVLEGERAALEAQVQALDDAVGAAGGGALYSRQVKIKDVRDALLPGEVYLKVAQVRANLYAIAITPAKTYIYPIKFTAPVLRREIVDPLLISARGITATDAQAKEFCNKLRTARTTPRLPDGTAEGAGVRLCSFDVERAYALFRTIAGPAEADLARATGIVFDPSGPLRSVPLGILVTSIDSAKAFRAQPAARRRDYSEVAFLGKQASISTALMPSSFLTVRKLTSGSSAPRSLIGFGQNAPAPAVTGDLARKPVLQGAGCAIGYASWANTLNASTPISANEIDLAARALGVSDARTVKGADFTDLALKADSDAGLLAQYQIVHFATHGLAEQTFTADGCPAVIPSALVTTIAPPAPDGTAVSDGLLSFGEVGRLKLNANLVVLSACDTAAGVSQQAGRLAGQESASSTLDGLVRAFVSANARAVMATYWAVPAASETEALMEEFYRAGRSANIGTALQAAQGKLQKQPEFSHPYFWGAYFLVGDAAKPMLTPSALASR